MRRSGEGADMQVIVSNNDEKSGGNTRGSLTPPVDDVFYDANDGSSLGEWLCNSGNPDLTDDLLTKSFNKDVSCNDSWKNSPSSNACLKNNLNDRCVEDNEPSLSNELLMQATRRKKINDGATDLLNLFKIPKKEGDDCQKRNFNKNLKNVRGNKKENDSSGLTNTNTDSTCRNGQRSTYGSISSTSNLSALFSNTPKTEHMDLDDKNHTTEKGTKIVEPIHIGTQLKGNLRHKKFKDESLDNTIKVSDHLQPMSSVTENGGLKKKVSEYLISNSKHVTSCCTLPRIPFNPTFFSKTLLGTFTFCLYHIVYTLAFASAIRRPYSSTSTSANSIVVYITGLGALGTIITGPAVVWTLDDFYSLYPCIDAFLVPFIAKFADIVDKVLYEEKLEAASHDSQSGDDELIFLCTLAVLSGLGMILSGIFNILASKFKLAHLGAFLPNAVLSGFFSSIGIMVWTLSFSVDNGGTGLIKTFQSGSISVIMNALLHHAPSLVLGTAMFVLGPKNPRWVLSLLFFGVLLVYLVLFVSKTTLATAQNNGWFYTGDDFLRSNFYATNTTGWEAPTPIGLLYAISTLNIQMKAVWNGLPTVFAMGFIYTLRCSLHAVAMKKNVKNIKQIVEKSFELKLMRKIEDEKEEEFLEEVDLLSTSPQDSLKKLQGTSVSEILRLYGCIQIASGLIGGYSSLPSFSSGGLMAKLGAFEKAPQYGSYLALLIVYLFDFKPVQFIPKIAFSSLLVLSSFELLHVWLYKPYFQTKEKLEFVVVPLIIASSYFVGMLNAVAIGTALSTFIFVTSFYKTGVVKFIDSGLTVRSTIERNGADAQWLDQHGDLIQVMVLQNYLFFGNANSCFNYIESMFEEVSLPPDSNFELPPLPKYLVIDMSFCTGIDTSAVTIFVDVISLCKGNNCSVIFSGLSHDLKESMLCGGIRIKRGYKNLQFCSNLEKALGNAEDGLLSNVLRNNDIETHRGRQRTLRRKNSNTDDGFNYALTQIDNQHGTNFAQMLEKLGQYTLPLTLNEKENLFQKQNGDGRIPETERGLFFIEYGLMKVERDPSQTLTRSRIMTNYANSLFSSHPLPGGGFTIGHVNARAPTMAKRQTLQKTYNIQRAQKSYTFRIAKIGPGWVIGSMESIANLRDPRIYTAVTKCRLHSLSLQAIENIEMNDPQLILNLYKMISQLMARRQDMTIEQLATLHSIITSPPLKKPLGRATMGAIRSTILSNI